MSKRDSVKGKSGPGLGLSLVRLLASGLLCAALSMPSPAAAGASGGANNEEGDGFVSVQIDLECPNPYGVNWHCWFEIYTDDGGTATADVDFEPRESVYFSTGPGTTTYPGGYEITLYDDVEDEPDETIRIVVVTTPENGPQETSYLYATILDDDHPPVVEPDCEAGPLSTLVSQIGVTGVPLDPTLEELACALADLGL